MTLRARLLLGYGYLVALVLVVAGSAVAGFLGLSAGIGEVLEENFASIRAAMTMTEALERQDSATLAELVEGPGAGGVVAEQERVFREALETAAANVTEPEEPEILAAIREEYGGYLEERGELVAARPVRPLAAYDQRVFPQFERVKHEVRTLLVVNQQAMFDAEREARAAALRSGTWLGFLVIVALVSLVFLSRALQRQVLSRIAELRSGVESIAAGGHGRLREQGSDELALVARYVNRLLDRAEEHEGQVRARLAQERRLVLGLVAAAGEGAVLYGLSGDRLAGDPRRLGEGGGERVAEWIRGQEETEARRGERAVGRARRLPAEGEGPSIEVELLIASGDRPVGWLARPVQE